MQYAIVSVIITPKDTSSKIKIIVYATTLYRGGFSILTKSSVAALNAFKMQ